MKKAMMIVVVLMAISIVLYGCGNSINDGNNENSATSEQESSKTSTTETAAAPSTSEPVKWIANTVYPPNNTHGVALEEFAEKVKVATNEIVTLQVSTGGALGYKGPELLKVVRDNAVVVSDILISGVTGDEPTFGVMTLPFLLHNFEEGKILSEIARPYFDKITEEKWNQKILYIAPWPAAGFWTKNEIKTLEDMKGIKMRTYDENGALVVQAVGGTPYPLPFSEVYSSLATGVIDSVLTSTPTAVDGKFWEVLEYYEPVNVTMATNMVTVNLDEFNKLDKSTQEAIIQTGKEMEAVMWEKVAAEDKKMEDIVTENGIITITPDDKLMNDLTAVTETIRADWLSKASVEAKEIVSKFEEAVGR